MKSVLIHMPRTTAVLGLVTLTAFGSTPGIAFGGSIAERGELGYRAACSIHELADTGFHCPEYQELHDLIERTGTPDYWPEDYDFDNPFIHDDLNAIGRTETVETVDRGPASEPATAKCTRSQTQNCDAAAQIAVQAPYLTGKMVAGALETATSSTAEILLGVTDPEAKVDKVQEWVDRSEELRDSARQVCLDLIGCDSAPEERVVDFEAYGGLPDEDAFVDADADTSIHPAELDEAFYDDTDFGEEVIDIDNLTEDYVDLDAIEEAAREVAWFEDLDGDFEVDGFGTFDEDGIPDMSEMTADELDTYLSEDSLDSGEGEQFAALMSDEGIDFDRPSRAPLDVTGEWSSGSSSRAPSSAESFFGFDDRSAGGGLSGDGIGSAMPRISYPPAPNASCGQVDVQTIRGAQCSVLASDVRGLKNYLRDLASWRQETGWGESDQRGSVSGELRAVRQCTEWSAKVLELEYTHRCR